VFVVWFVLLQTKKQQHTYIYVYIYIYIYYICLLCLNNTFKLFDVVISLYIYIIYMCGLLLLLSVGVSCV
jgi:hypothetical protein